jgi:hypothetical protein
MPLSGVTYCVTDDEDCYNDTFDGRVKCLFHRLRTRARSDERVDTVAEEGRREELETYLETEYTELYETEVDDLKDEYPSFWDEKREEFTGPVTTNAIEGGNWRLKDKLGVPYRQGGYGMRAGIVECVERFIVSVQQRASGGELRSPPWFIQLPENHGRRIGTVARSGVSSTTATDARSGDVAAATRRFDGHSGGKSTTLPLPQMTQLFVAR